MHWFYWLIPATFFVYAFFQRVAPSVLVSELMRDFNITGATIGNISAFYYYTYAAIQVPAGLLLDRFGPKAILGSFALICAIGSYLFASADSTFDLYVGRFLIGLGAGVSFVGTLKVADMWFSVRQFSYISGLTFSLGLVGGLLGQAPLVALVSQFGWRRTMESATVLVLALSIFIVFFVKDNKTRRGSRPKGIVVWRNLISVLRTTQIWIIAISGGGMAAIITSFTGLWIVPFLIEAKEISKSVSASLASIIFLGTMIGAPLAGLFSGYFKQHKPIFLFATWLVFSDIILIVYVDFSVSWEFYTLLFSLGLGLGCVVTIYSIARTYSPPGAEGTTIAFVNMLVIGLGAAFQPIIGFLLDFYWAGNLLDGARIYAIDAYLIAFGSLVIVSFSTLLFGMMIRETRL